MHATWHISEYFSEQESREWKGITFLLLIIAIDERFIKYHRRLVFEPKCY